jgi:KUP system potassium uptake protein
MTFETAPASAALSRLDTHSPHGGRRDLFGMVLGSVGIVYGDIGTSPLYAMKESLLHVGHMPSPDEIVGIVSLLVWSLIIVVTLKYIVLVLRADNHGEGGALALMALAQRAFSSSSARSAPPCSTATRSSPPPCRCSRRSRASRSRRPAWTTTSCPSPSS